MLKAVIEQVEFAAEFLFGQEARLVPVSANDHGRFQLARNQQRLIAELRRRAIGIDDRNFGGRATVAAGENVEGDAALCQNWPRAITKGVLPLPPTEIFPMLTTRRASFFT